MFNSQSHRSLKKAIALRLLLVFLHGFTINKEHHCSNHPFSKPADSPHLVPLIMHSSIAMLTFDGHISFENVDRAATDFGNRYHLMPSAVLLPKSVSDISSIMKYIFDMGVTSELTVAARGHGHSVDVSAGQLWINILHESLKQGLAPKSWTDYLHLTVGGTLSSAGISGQAFRHGPQINNVYQQIPWLYQN